MRQRERASTRGDSPSRRPARSRFRVAITAVAVAIGIAASPLQAVAPASALVTDGFNAANIISDTNFYAGKAMSASAIQSFLNARVPRCTIGDSGRAPGSDWGNTKIASKCLRDATFSSSSRASNAYCGAYAGGKNESAATIIAKVGAACGISPKVLLVMLEKEQSLVSDTWPTVRQFDFAMGYDCPDSGPNNSADCNSGASGFAAQVYRAAWQLQVYRAFPANYNYRAGRANTIQWHPSTSCGTSQVNIANEATAALYIYTPYRPNQAALNAGWGTGDGCSSYGNRNFFNFYKTWFGSPTGIEVHAKLRSLYNSTGGAGGKLGAVTQAAVSANGAVGQQFANGAIYWSSQTGAQYVLDGFRKRHLAEGGFTGALGLPLGPESSKRSGAVKQDFQGGTLYWGRGIGTYLINGATLKLYRSKGDYTGFMGLPISDSIRTGTGIARRDFEGASVYWSKAHGSFVLHGSVRATYKWAGSATGRLGSPTREEYKTKKGVAIQEFEQGRIYWSKAHGAHVLRGGILSTYLKAGGPDGALGVPLESENKSKPGVTTQRFSGGTITWSSSKGKVTLKNSKNSDQRALEDLQLPETPEPIEDPDATDTDTPDTETPDTPDAETPDTGAPDPEEPGDGDPDGAPVPEEPDGETPDPADPGSGDDDAPEPTRAPALRVPSRVSALDSVP